MSVEGEYQPPEIITRSPLARPTTECDHIHDFGTGAGLTCTVCQRTAQDLAVNSGGRNINDTADDGFRFAHKLKASLASRGVLTGSAPPAVDAAPLNRMDVVAHAWHLKRRPNEDDDSLATRVRRAASTVPVRPAVPPMDWVPPPKYRLGDPWLVPVATSCRTYDMELGENGQARIVSSAPTEMKRLN